MATASLFVATVDILKSKIRLSGVESTSDASSIIDEAVLTVRAGFYRELGSPRVAQIQALPFTENPVTDDQVMRAVANSTEVKWVKAELLRTMPMSFMDGNADQNQVFQDEALFRDASQHQIDLERISLESDIQQNLDLLRGIESIASEASLRVETLAPAIAPPLPGDTIIPPHILGRRI